MWQTRGFFCIVFKINCSPFLLILYLFFFLLEKSHPMFGNTDFIHFIQCYINIMLVSQITQFCPILQLVIIPLIQLIPTIIKEVINLIIFYMELKQQTTKADKPAQKVKTKVRFTSLDVAAMVAELQMLIGLRVSNIYDINPTTYILKMSRSQQKHHLLIENGVRFHLTEEKPDKKNLPSGFTMKFRRYLRSKRIESIRQVGVERVVVISFGSQAFANHLILQLYSQGNIILTDDKYRILQCMRSHEFNDKVKTAVGEIYPFEHAANIYIENIDISKQALQKNLAPPTQVQQTATQLPPKKKGKQQNKGAPKTKDVIFKLIPCLYPLVIEHILLTKGFDPESKIQGEQGKTIALKGAAVCLDFLKNFIGKVQPGYLYSKGEEYFQFSPFNNCKLQKLSLLKKQTFGSAVTEYFSKYKKTAHQEEQVFQELAWRKYEQIRKDQEERVRKLVEEQETYGGKAELIEKNIEEVQAVLKIIATMESNGYSWQAMERMVSESRKTGDPLANMIHSFNAQKRVITVLLSDTTNGDAVLCALTPVELNVDYNAYTNATIYYEGRKKQQQKQQRTRQASDQVLKLAEKDAVKKIQKKKNQLLLKAVPTRKQLWFQKFYWFISSDGWLVISGRDSHQNQLLVKRYMKAGDLYMHSDYGGAASTIIKGQPKQGFAPPLTLEQAAIFTVCRSKAWDTKIISSSWWVYHDQVSKSAPTGQFLPTGSFMIRGKRNFIHPNRMQMGITLLYRLDNESMLRRIQHRKSLKEQQKLEDGQKQIQNIGRVPSQKQQNEEYAIIDLQAQARQAKQKKKQKIAQNKANKAKNLLPQEPLKKQASIQQKPEQSDQQEQNSDDEDKETETKRDYKKQAKKEDSKNTKKKVVQEQVHQKHKNRNKKKLKKLDKYLDEQDEDQRQLIMKMLGAKEMKHLKEDEEEQQPERKQPKGKKQQKKKGIEKYLNMNQEETIIDTDKVLFLKGKQKEKEKEKGKGKAEESSSDQNQIEIKEQPVLQNIVEDKSKLPQEDTNKQAQTLEGTQTKEEKAELEGEKEEEGADSDQEGQAEAQKPDEKVEEEEVDEKVIDSQLSQLPRLTGKIQGADKWDALVPMCAPYPTIKDNRFKVKLVPGGLKKGKAARSILGFFATNDLEQTEKAFVRALPEQELINALLGNVKLAGAGLLKIEQKSKAEKKQKRKQQDKKATD